MSGIPSWARVGAKVVYVDDSPGLLVEDDRDPLVVGEIYVLVALSDEFAEAACRVNGCLLLDDEYLRLSRFRPLITQQDDIEAHFTQLLDVDSPIGVDA